MAIIKPATPFDSVKRKFSGTDEIHFKNRTADNATIGVRMKHPTYTAAFKAQKGKRNGYLYLRDFIVAQEFVKPVSE